MRSTGSRLSDYYRSIGLNPVGHDISRSAKLRLHERKRQNLLEHHLRLPLLAWRGARVLEFGPGSGENAVLLARLGARFTFVEPLRYLSDRLRERFAEFRVSHRIEAVHTGLLEDFRSRERFDVVFAEGFVHFLEDREAAVRKLLSFTADEGFVVLSDLDGPGNFIEFMKRCWLEQASAALGLDGDERRLELARRFFAPEFERINHSRPFESWAKDMVLNPLYTPRAFLGLPDVLAALPKGAALYSSWPGYLDFDDLLWHKSLRDEASMRRMALEGYFARAPHFLHSTPRPRGGLELFSPGEGRRVVSALRACYARLDRLLRRRRAEPREAMDALSALRGSFPRGARSGESLAVIDDAVALFKAARAARGEDALARAWRSRGPLRRLWGTPGHYLVLHKTGLYSG